MKANRPGGIRRDQLARQPLGIVLEARHVLDHQTGAVARRQFLQPPLADPLRRDLAGQVALALGWGAAVAGDQIEHPLVELSARWSSTGGMISPSWCSSVASGIEPGVMPPTSAWWRAAGDSETRDYEDLGLHTPATPS